MLQQTMCMSRPCSRNKSCAATGWTAHPLLPPSPPQAPPYAMHGRFGLIESHFWGLRRVSSEVAFAQCAARSPNPPRPVTGYDLRVRRGAARKRAAAAVGSEDALGLCIKGSA